MSFLENHLARLETKTKTTSLDSCFSLFSCSDTTIIKCSSHNNKKMRSVNKKCSRPLAPITVIDLSVFADWYRQSSNLWFKNCCSIASESMPRFTRIKMAIITTMSKLEFSRRSLKGLKKFLKHFWVILIENVKRKRRTEFEEINKGISWPRILL